MSPNSGYANGTFANPNVRKDIVECIVNYLKDNGKSHPHEVISYVMNKKAVSRGCVVEGMRKLRMSNTIVPAEPFVGEVEVIDS
jgi:hypothetical protein